jgi:asparagine synthase (glutamine-hydrolysing)
MCGICGFIDRDRRATGDSYPPLISTMTASLAHRGPDGCGHWIDQHQGVALGHRRLAVIDTSPSGEQPMVSRDGRVALVFNGEIYNFRRLRNALEQQGCRLKGQSDTEVLVEAIALWGVDSTLDRLIGIFAFAVWELDTRRLTLARDHLGVKPVYWAPLGRGIIFGSQPRVFRLFPGWSSELNPDALASVLRFGHVAAPACIYRQAHCLMPGTTLTWQTDAPGPRIREFYKLTDAARSGQAAPFVQSDDEAIERLDSLFAEILEDQMIADVPLGAFLSGGIDSTLVVAMMQRHSSRPVRTFTIGFEQGDYNEATDASVVAAYLGTEHTEHIVSGAELSSLAAKLPEVYDEPFADASQIPTMLVSALAADSVTVVLSGDGGDELFAGYNRHLWAARIWRSIGGTPVGLRRLFAASLSYPSPRFWNRLSLLIPYRRRPRQLGDKIDKLARLAHQRDLGSVYAELRTQIRSPEHYLSCQAHGSATPVICSGLDDVSALQLVDAGGYLPDDILVKVDRASMFYGLEARVPLLDQRLVDFSWRLDPRLKIRDSQGKWILRELLYRHVPRELVDRPKSGFSVPVDDWLRGPLRAWADGLLMDGDSAQDVVDLASVRNLWRGHIEGKIQAGRSLWPLVMLVAWIDYWRP